MSRLELFERRIEELRDESRKLVEWCFRNVKLYKATAPALVDDIRRFEDCAAAIDAFSAGLSVVPPHPALRMELLRWVRTDEQKPDDARMVMMFSEGPWPGYLDGTIWRCADGMPLGKVGPTYWAEMPVGPQSDAARIEEAAA